MVVADVIPNPPRTGLIREAAERGCTVLDGLGMIVKQGVVGIRLWTGRDPDPAVMRAAHSRPSSRHRPGERRADLAARPGQGSWRRPALRGRTNQNRMHECAPIRSELARSRPPLASLAEDDHADGSSPPRHSPGTGHTPQSADRPPGVKSHHARPGSGTTKLRDLARGADGLLAVHEAGQHPEHVRLSALPLSGARRDDPAHGIGSGDRRALSRGGAVKTFADVGSMDGAVASAGTGISGASRSRPTWPGRPLPEADVIILREELSRCSIARYDALPEGGAVIVHDTAAVATQRRMASVGFHASYVECLGDSALVIGLK